MKQTNQLFSFSLPIFKETMKKGWLISLVSFIALFATSTLLIAQVGPEPFMKSEGYIGYLMVYFPNYYYIALGAIAVVTAMFTLNYIHSKALAVSVHALPLNRKKLYITKYISGLIISLAPVILNGIIMAIFAGGIISKANELMDKGYFNTGVDPLDGVITVSDVMSLMAISMIALIVSYSISVLAGVIAGNIVYHGIAAVVLNSVLVVLAYCFNLLEGKFLFGYTFISESIKGDQSFISMLIHGDIFAHYLHPLYYATVYNGLNNVLYGVIWIAIFIAVSFAAYFVYKKAGLERSGENAIFRVSNNVITFTVSFFAMVLVGYFIPDFIYGYNKFALPFVLTGIIIFIVCQMILNKKLNVFNLSLAKRITVFTVIVLLLIAIPVFDVSGYGKAVPDTTSVETVVIDSDGVTNVGALDDYNKNIKIKDKDNIEAMANFHQAIIDNRKDIEVAVEQENAGEYTSENINYLRMINFSYVLKDGTVMSRAYSLPESIYSNENFVKVIESKEYKEQVTIVNRLKGKVNSISSSEYSELYGDMGSSVTISGKEAETLAELLDKDFMNMNFKEMTESYDDSDMIEFNIYFEPDKNTEVDKYEEPNYGFGYGQQSFIYMVGSNYKESIKWLKDKGYYDTIVDGSERADEGA